MKKGIVAALIGVVVALVPAATASAQSYNGTAVAPESDGTTYNVVASAGDTVTLTEVGNGSIAVTFSNDVNGQFIITESSSRPASATSDAPGAVNLYFDVTLNGITNDDISSAKWTFSVEQSFLNQHDATAQNVFLYHFNGSSWEQLTTTQVSSSDTSVTFEAQVNNFSPFAITAVEGLSNTGSPYLLGAVLGIGTLAAVGGAFYLSRRQTAS